ncbi:hypothetical protein VTH06DRAFT_345 [Thermothelomyces fergusii]
MSAPGAIQADDALSRRDGVPPRGEIDGSDMRPSASAVVCASFAAGVAGASRRGMALIPGSASPGLGLLPRQNPFCTTESTCAECFGDGSIVCDDIGCFNPDEYEQCCAGAAICVGKDNSCCEGFGGPGVTGTAGVPTGTTAATPTPTDDGHSQWYACRRGDTGEECCQRAPDPPLHWCSGEFPSFVCYNAENQSCCANGKVCSGEDCCALFNTTATHPWSSARPSTATTVLSSSASGSSAPATVTEPPTSPPSSDPADSSSTASTTSAGAGSVIGPNSSSRAGMVSDV